MSDSKIREPVLTDLARIEVKGRKRRFLITNKRDGTMSIKTVLQSFAITGAALVLLSGSAQAGNVRSEKISIPFSFEVQKRVLPAGEYRVEQGFGSPVAELVNVRTGSRVQLLRASSDYQEGKSTLIFEIRENNHSLKRIS
jgi:hypothetical protein